MEGEKTVEKSLPISSRLPVELLNAFASLPDECYSKNFATHKGAQNA
jgi:hypothetical protein